MSYLDLIMEEMRKISKDVVKVVRAVMASSRGINDKVGKNTLIDSNLYKELECDVDSIEVVRLLVNSYVQYVERGRKPGSFPPPNAIIEWATRKGIPTDNGTIYAICMSIYKYGISPRPFIDYSLEETEKDFEARWADDLFKALIQPLKDYFID